MEHNLAAGGAAVVVRAAAAEATAERPCDIAPTPKTHWEQALDDLGESWLANLPVVLMDPRPS